MASCSQKSAAEANLLGKRKPEDGLETKSILKRYKEKSEEKEQMEGSVELSETKSDEANLISVEETPDFVEEAAAEPKKSVVVPETEISDIIDFFKDVGEIVRVRLCVDHWGEHAGCCFVDFASANEANKTVQEKQSKGYYNLLLKVAEMDRPYPFRAKYKLAEKLWYEDNLRREGFGLTIKSKVRKAEPTIFCGPL